MTQDSLFGREDELVPRSSVTTKLPTYRAPSGASMSEAEQVQYRRMAFAFALEAKRKLDRPVSLAEFYWGIWEWKGGLKTREVVQGIQGRVQDLIGEGVWAFAEYARSKRTVDRRVNESAADDFCPGNVSFLVCVSPGIYQINPKRLEGSI